MEYCVPDEVTIHEYPTEANDDNISPKTKDQQNGLAGKGTCHAD